MCVGWCKYNLKCSATPVDLFFSISSSPPLSPFLLSPLLRPPPPFPLFTPLPLLSLRLLFCLPHPPSYFSSSPSPPLLFTPLPLFSLSPSSFLSSSPFLLSLSLLRPPPPLSYVYPTAPPLSSLSPFFTPPDPSLFFPLFTPPLSLILSTPPPPLLSSSPISHLSLSPPPPPY